VTSVVKNVTDVWQRSRRYLHDTARLRCTRSRQNNDWRHARTTHRNWAFLGISVKWQI